MICPQCHTENAPGDKFCEQCGFPLGGAAQGDEDNAAATMVGAPLTGGTLVNASDPSQRFPLGNRVVVGRLDTCDIPVHDKSVSREHARLSQLPGGYVVEDLDSTNGTLVNGDRVTDAVILRPGDTVTFGSVDFKFEEERAALASAGGSSASTQPFVYRPPEQPQESAPEPPAPPAPTPFAPAPGQPAASDWSLPSAQPEPVVEPEPAAEQPAPFFDFPPLQPVTPVNAEPPAASATPSPPAAQESVASSPLPAFEPVPTQPQPFEPVPTQPPAPEPVPVQPPPAEPQVAVGWNPTPAASPQPDTAPATVESATAPPFSPTFTSAPQPESPATPAGGPAALSSVPVDSAASAIPGDAIETANRLVDVVRTLVDQVAAAESERAGLYGRIRDLEGRLGARDAAARALQDLPVRSVSPQQLQATQDMLDQLIRDPRDIELLLQIGRQAADVAAIVNECSQLRRATERAAEALGVHLQQ